MSPLPPALSRLLQAATDDERRLAWQRFVDEHTRLLLHVARSIHPTHDEAMDAYAHLLEQLAADDHRLLRKYGDDGRSKFTTWLVVVSRRLCLDLYRRRYGRPRDTDSDASRRARDLRRRLHTAVGSDQDATHIPEPAIGAEEWLRQTELHAALDAALATLDASDRLIVQLRFEQDLSAQEIARLVGLPSPFHVYRRLTAITASLRRLLAARGVESAVP
jgi:RNA polymerase sigma factor (sigma-70 family)